MTTPRCQMVGKVAMWELEDGTIDASTTRLCPGVRKADLEAAEAALVAERTRVISSLSSEADRLLEQIAVSQGEDLTNGIRDCFSVIEELGTIASEAAIELAIEKLESMLSYADLIGSSDLQLNSELYIEVLSHLQTPDYSLDQAQYLAGQAGVSLDPENPLDGLSDALYPLSGGEYVPGAGGKSESAQKIYESIQPVDQPLRGLGYYLDKIRSE